MSLHLTSDDLRQLTRAMRLLSSPLDHACVDGWRAAVNRFLRELLRADSAGFLLPVPDGLMMFSEEHDPTELARYPDYPPPPLANGTPVFERMVELGVMTLEMGYGEEHGAYLNSAYYNEYAGANGAHDTLAMAVPLGGADIREVASLQFWHARPKGRRFGEREVGLLRLLLPSLQAGAESYARWGRQGDDLLHTLESLNQPAVVFDLAGRLLHVTPSLEAVLAADPEAAVLRAHLRAIGNRLRRVAIGGGAADGATAGSLVREVRTRAARYRLCGCLHGAAAGGAACVAVGLERLSPAPPSAKRLRERFGLTAAQARVALLLAERLSNPEIAERLSISPHTARRHTEAAMEKLGVSDRRRVAERILERAGG